MPAADAPMDAASTPAVRFDPRFLIGDASRIDLSGFAEGERFIAGLYRVDVHVNDVWKGRRDLKFTLDPRGRGTACLDAMILQELDIEADAALAATGEDVPCRPVHQWITAAQERFDAATLRYDLSIPQAFLRRTPRGYVSPNLWDRGITAGYLGYHLNALDSETRSGRGNERRRSAYVGLDAGLNMRGWQLRHRSNVSWFEGDGVDVRNIATYLQRPLPHRGSMLVIGDTHTGGELFDSVPYRGVSLASDERMLPDSLRGYAPVVRGIAESRALVEVRQNGQLLHSVGVAPGAFVIDDLFPSGYGGDLDVLIIEADGRKRPFKVPYGSVTQMIRPGSSRYSLTAGRVRDPLLVDEPGLLQWTYQRGVSNGLTLYGGMAGSQGYGSVLYGAGVSTRLGAFSLDVTQARTELEHAGRFTGASTRLSYSNMLDATDTRFTLAAYRYSTAGFFGLHDALQARDRLGRADEPSPQGRTRSRFQLTLSQPLAEGWGTFNLTGSLSDFWDLRGSAQYYQVGYSNSFRRVGVGLSAVRSAHSQSTPDTQYLLSFSVPLGQGSRAVSLNGDASVDSRGDRQSGLGITGTWGANDRIRYGASLSNGENGGSVASAHVDLVTSASTLGASYSHASDYRQATLSASGSLVVHPGGVTATPQRGETMVIVHAPSARDANVQNIPGVQLNARGYAVVPSVSPYRLNTVTLDPRGMSHEVELQDSSRTIAPVAGAISLLRFETRTGQALLVNARRASGEPLPFGARVLDADGQRVGVVGQGGLAYVRMRAATGTLTATWGAQAEQSCQITYEAPGKVLSGNGPLPRVDATCS